MKNQKKKKQFKRITITRVKQCVIIIRRMRLAEA